MFTLITWVRILFAALALSAFLPNAPAFGQRSATQTQTTTPARARTAAEQATETAEDRPPAGDPVLGVVIIIGIIAFLIVVAWIFSRTGDDGSRGPDRNLL